MPAATELIAHNRSVEQIAEIIGADDLIFQDLDDLKAAVRYNKASIDVFEACCFDGDYVTGDVDSEYLEMLEAERLDGNKSKNSGEDLVLL